MWQTPLLGEAARNHPLTKQKRDREFLTPSAFSTGKAQAMRGGGGAEELDPFLFVLHASKRSGTVSMAYPLLTRCSSFASARFKGFSSIGETHTVGRM